MAAVSWLIFSGAGSSATQSDKAQITSMIRAGEQALVDDHPRVVCGWMTRHARRLSHRYLYTGDGSGGFDKYRGPTPTCSRALHSEGDHYRAPQDLAELRADPRLRFRKLTATRAVVTLRRFDYTITFVKTRAGWRADSANSFPFDGSSGE